MKTLTFTVFLVAFTAEIYAQWAPVGLSSKNIYALWARGDTILAGASRGAIFRSTNAGLDWDTCNTTVIPRNNQVSSFSFLDTILIAGTGYGSFTGSGTGGVYRSFDNGRNWSLASSGLPAEWLDVLTTYEYNGLLFAGTDVGLFVSTDCGDLWTPRDTTLLDLVCILSIPEQSNGLYAGRFINGVVVSTDCGYTWNSANAGLPAGKSVYNLIGVNGKVYASVGGQKGVYFVSNLGGTWAAVNAGLPNTAVLALLAVDGQVLASTYSVSTGYNGRTSILRNDDTLWTDWSAGLSGAPILVLARNQQYIFAAGELGVWRRAISELVGIRTAMGSALPSSFSLGQNYPNPFNSTTIIPLELSRAESIELKVYDVLGREVATLLNEKKMPGSYRIPFEARSLASGVYFYRMRVGDFSAAHALVLAR